MPLDIFLNKNCEALAFPTLFPTGKGTLYGDQLPDSQNNSTDHKITISPSKYFRQRITMLMADLQLIYPSCPMLFI